VTIYNQIDSNKRKTWIIFAVFILFITFLGFFVGNILGYGNGFIIFAVLSASFTTLISYYFSDSIALSLSGAEKADPLKYLKLHHIVENLCIGAGIDKPQVYVINDSAINAFATGRDPKHASIVFTSGVLTRLEDEEIEGIASHEISHIRNFDTRLMVVVAILVGSVTLLADFLFRSFLFRGRSRDDNVNPLLVLVGFLLLLLSPLVATLIQLAISRNREYLADASGALLTRYPEGLARALEKISQDRDPLKSANKATAHLYIANPLKNRKDTVSLFANLFNTHPPIEDRIRRLREM